MALPSELVAPHAELEQLATGFGFTEGPAWCDAGRFLVFSDIPGDVLLRWDDQTGMSEYRRPSHMANGNVYDHQGRLVTCEHATNRVVRESDGKLEVLADRFSGGELNSPNDIVVGPDQALYFTDPTYGRQDYYGQPRPTWQPHRGLYRISPAGAVELLESDFDQPNGLCFSLDGCRLFVNDTERGHIRVFSFTAGGRLAGGEVFAEVTGEGDGAPDGMKIDGLGNVWCTGPGGIHVFDDTGRSLGHLPVPEVVGNFAWGGVDRRRLFVCASTSLYHLSTQVPGGR